MLKRLFLSTCMALSLNAQADTTVFFVTQQQAATALKAQIEASVRYMNTQPAGDQAIYVNMDSLSQVATYALPKEAYYNSPKARMKYNLRPLAALQRFKKAAQAVTAPTSNIPAALRYVAQNLSNGEPLTVVFLGAHVLFNDPKAHGHALTMRDAQLFSDGYLNAPRHLSPFSTTNSQAFKGMRVYLGLGSTAFASDRHGYLVQRFYQLYIEQQGGSLHSWVRDLTTLMDNVANKAPALPAPPERIDGIDSEKLQILQLRTETQTQALFDRPVSTAPLTAQAITQAENVEIGIRWTPCLQPCDLDLWVQPFPQAKPIYFGNPKTPLATLYKDHTSASSAKNSPNGYETIAFNPAQRVDLNALTVAVNLYRGAAPEGVSFDLRLAVNGKTYSGRYRIPAKRGNKGKDVGAVLASGASSAHTLLIDVVKLVGR